MAFLRFRVANTLVMANGDSAIVSGKNGFYTSLGTIPVLVTSYTTADVSTNISFTVTGLNNLMDDNFGNHIFPVAQLAAYAGTVVVTHPVNQKVSDGIEAGYVGYQPITSEITSNIVDYNLSAGTFKIENRSSNGMTLFSKLPDSPFYVKLYQVIDSGHFANNTIYVAGKERTFDKLYNVHANTGSYTADIGIKPIAKEFISVWLDETKLNVSAFTWDNRANVSLTLASDSHFLRTQTKVYGPPAIEVGDNISVGHSNVYAVNAVSYVSGSATYNVALTANTFYKVKINANIRSNVTGATGVNVSPDIYGRIGNVNNAANTFTIDYDAESFVSGQFLLNNTQGVYKLALGGSYNTVKLAEERTIHDVHDGPFSVRAYNVNPAGRRSFTSTKSILIDPVRLPAVTDLTVTESLYFDTTQGIATRATISFTHITGKQISDYEISYKLGGEATDLTSFNTVLVSAAGIDTDGKIRYVINNIDRGRTQGVNTLTIRVVALNKDIRGVPRELEHSITGKSEAPQNVSNFTVGQNGTNMIFIWEVARNADGTVVDIDLQEIEIRRYSGTLTTATEWLDNWGASVHVASVAVPATTFLYPVTVYGTYTYLIRTVDTSRNESATVKGYVLTTARPVNLSSYKVWSEDNPSANDVIAGQTNENYREYYWPSYANSDNGGFNYAVDDPVTAGVGPSTLVENANGTTSGFSVAVDLTDLNATANAYYITQFRDIGTIVRGSIISTVNAFQELSSTWNDLKETLFTGVSDTSASNILVDIGSYVGALFTSNSATYDATHNKTLISGGSSGNVYAIWNEGQFVGDVSNANSFALITGVINANAIAFGRTFYANGRPSNSNLLPNIGAAASTYSVVNLKQWSDPDAAFTWSGPDSILSYNVEIKYSTNNVYYQTANVNVNVAAVSSGNVFITYNSNDVDMRWFQLRLNIRNSNPSLISSVLDQFNYRVDLPDRVYSTSVSVTSNPTTVNYTSEEFLSTPNITITPLIDSTLRVNNTFAALLYSNSTYANITVYSNTGAFVSGVTVNLQAIGN